MKRIIVFLLAISLVLSLAACGAPAKEPEVQDQQLVKPDTADEAEAQTTDPKPETQEQSASRETPTEPSDTEKEETPEAQPQTKPAEQEKDNAKQESDTSGQKETEQPEDEPIAPNNRYVEGVLLVKVKETLNAADFGQLAYISAEPLYAGSKWYTVKLADAEKTVEAFTYLTGHGTFASVDYDYVMSGDATAEAVDVSGNPDYGKHKHHHTHKVPDGWKYATDNGKHPGGSSDVVIAVIDTGVDYTHLDLRNNIWVNSAEIPNNGMDDDGNGYIDDVYGWDCVGDDSDPMDDNGHGTHVAGIIAAENNQLGGVGIAYNCKIMVLKAGNSSGYFNNSDIAEAVQYAYMNGASVINMSFGGSSISMAVEEALENAYNTCVLVAAAGNDGACNKLDCQTCDIVGVSYPAALPYVIGVMSTNQDGSAVSAFSNYDHDPYNSVEYEVYAVGEAVPSCWPGNKYASLNGTSMAAPTVSGIAALLRSYYSDREMYSTKFIQSQIVNTGTLNPYNYATKKTDGAHCVTNIYEALTQIPKPEVNLYDYSIDDSADISSVNNGNGVIDAGETVRLYISLHNRGGVASNVRVSIDADRGAGLTDPYFAFVNTAIELSDIGTYSVRESGDQYFEIVVSADCPNDYLVDFNIRYTYQNGMDEKDTTVYSDGGNQKAQFNVSNGIYLPLVISQDTTLQANRKYLISNPVYINENVTLTIEAGAKIVATGSRGSIANEGRIVCNGTQDQMVSIQNVSIDNGSNGYAEYRYVEICEGYTEPDVMDHCICIGGGHSGNITNSKFVDSRASGNVENCQMVWNKELTFDCSPYSTGSTAQISNYKNCVYLANTCTIVAHTRPAITVDKISLKVSAADKLYIGMNCTFEGGSPYCNPMALLYEANLLASCFGGRLASLSDTQASEMGVTLYVRTERLTTGYNSKEARILFEVDNLDISDEEILQGYNTYCEKYAAMPYFENTAILSANTQIDTGYSLKNLEAKYRYNLANAYWGTGDINAIQAMLNNYGTYGQYLSVIPDAYLENPTEQMWPMVSNIYILDQDGEAVSVIGNQTVKFVVEFNRDMDMAIPLNVTFGTIAPYADYKINGEWETARRWVGEYTLKSSIENGKQYIMISNAQAAEDAFFTAEDKTGRFTFTIDTAAAMAMNLQAVAKDEGIELTFAQDDYDTLLGYNIYRSTEKDGNFVKLNPTILLPEENTFLDDNAEPGKTYWYTYTVVLSDFTESNPAGKVQATAKDTMAPSLYHTPVNQGYENNNLVVSCTATDNVAIQTVSLFYRSVGEAQWKSLTMSKQNNKYSATIFGSDVTLAGLEYYIVASDGINEVMKGSAEAPYTVVVKSADSLLGKGDVDGNGSVTTKDALMLMQCLNGDLLLADDAFKRADLNGDGVLSSAEALRILQYINGKVTNLDM